MKLVSAIMPTRGRPELAAKALQCFLDQTYSDKTLVILDDKEDPSFPFGLTRSGVAYLAMDSRLNIPEKLNICCHTAVGEIIIRWDDDDWGSVDRMADQVYRLEESGKQVTGYHSMLFHEEPSGRSLKYRGRAADFALGTSLCFMKAWWQAHRFNESLPTGEDYDFVQAAVREDRLVSVDAGSMMVARIHEGNTSRKNTVGKLEYRPVDRSALPEAFFL